MSHVAERYDTIRESAGRNKNLKPIRIAPVNLHGAFGFPQFHFHRMGRVIKKNLGQYANPNLAQSAKAAVLASMMEYLNGEEFVRIVTAPLAYKSPAFVQSTEQDLGVMGIEYSPTNANQRYAGCRVLVCVELRFSRLLEIKFPQRRS